MQSAHNGRLDEIYSYDTMHGDYRPRGEPRKAEKLHDLYLSTWMCIASLSQEGKIQIAVWSCRDLQESSEQNSHQPDI